ncbi:MAG TPA: methyltransferase domain-containing protein [Candidatus Anoxymicrobiaceae bacterium]
MKKPYSNFFYDEFHEQTLASARVVVPTVMELLQPASVVDLGCGRGVMLSVFMKCGVDDVVGIDGPWVDKDTLMIAESSFVTAELAAPVELGRTFDLAVSLEVAEHLPQDSADSFVETLTNLAPAVLFSAAIPYQGGKNHVNEQWPDYWAERFEKRSFLTIDCIRKRVWDDDRVVFWYSQNMLLFAREDLVAGSRTLQDELALTNRSMLSFVHPKKYLPSARVVAKIRDILPERAQRAVYKRLGKS